MAVASPVVHVERCLAQVPGYRPETKHRLLNEIPALLNQMVSLKCQVAVHDEGQGRPTSLVQLFGTIPIYYKSVQYNIPVVIWILETYPVVPPKCYVTPTPDMRIKERHRHVDQNGLVYLPYLHGWKPAQSNLDELVSFMSSVFSDDPPVYRYEPPAGPPPPALPVAKPAAVKPLSPRPANPSPPPVSVPAPKPHASVIQNDVTATAVKKEKLVNAVTSKLQATLTDFNKQFQRELDGLFEKQQRLNAGSSSIADAIAALKKEQEVLRASVETVSAKSAELSKWLADNESSQELDVDSAVLPQTVWARQLFEAVAGDSAIEDTLYELDNAFRDERLDLQTYLKQIRKLARAQFFHRALALKIVEKQTQINSQQQRLGQMM